MTRPRPSTLYRRIYAVVAQIPRGRVVTYGQIARLVGCGARQVGYALAASPEGLGLPWQRVINSQGRVSPRRDAHGHLFQQLLLEREGVRFDGSGRIDFGVFGWQRTQRTRRARCAAAIRDAVPRRG